MKIGWMIDPGLPRAGMVLSVEAFAAASPYELVLCSPDKRPPDNLDAFVCHGDLFNQRWIEVLADKPFMAHRHGGWYVGDPVMRRWILNNADLITFNSPKQRELFRYEVNVPEDFVPLPIDVERFKDAQNGCDRTKDVIFLGLILPAKGISYTVDWALENHRPVDFYGVAMYPQILKEIEPHCRYKGPLSYEEVPSVLASYENFIFTPHEPDLYARVTVEAHAAGCNLILRGDAKALFRWMNLDTCQRAPQMFWEKFESIL